MSELLTDVLPELIATLIGILIGTLLAMRIDRSTLHKQKIKRRDITLRNLKQELETNFHTVKTVLPAYRDTPYGKGIYVSSIAWETAVSHGDLQEIIGSRLADIIENQYSRFMNLRYYVDLLTQLWFAPRDIDGYEDIQKEFRRKIIEIIESIIEENDQLMSAIDERL